MRLFGRKNAYSLSLRLSFQGPGERAALGSRALGSLSPSRGLQGSASTTGCDKWSHDLSCQPLAHHLASAAPGPLDPPIQRCPRGSAVPLPGLRPTTSPVYLFETIYAMLSLHQALFRDFRDIYPSVQSRCCYVLILQTQKLRHRDAK